MLAIPDRARAYLAKMPPAISKAGGHTAAFNVALALVKGFDLSEETALDLMREWNATCVPPWSEAELRHKIRSAAQSDRESGNLLKGSTVFAGQFPRGTPVAPKPMSQSDQEEEKRAQARAQWPSRFKPLTDDEIRCVAQLRDVPPEAVRILAWRRFLSSAMEDGHRCYILHEDDYAQASRLDKGKLETRQGPQRKKNLYGSKAAGAFLGAQWLGGPRVKVLLVEGSIALLEGVAAWMIVAPDEGWTVLAATSAGSRFDRNPDLLRKLRGRRVSILADPGVAGSQGAASWLHDLEGVGCEVKVLGLPNEIKDLGPLVANPVVHLDTLREIFA